MTRGKQKDKRKVTHGTKTVEPARPSGVALARSSTRSRADAIQTVQELEEKSRTHWRYRSDHRAAMKPTFATAVTYWHVGPQSLRIKARKRVSNMRSEPRRPKMKKVEERLCSDRSMRCIVQNYWRAGRCRRRRPELGISKSSLLGYWMLKFDVRDRACRDPFGSESSLG